MIFFLCAVFFFPFLTKVTNSIQAAFWTHYYKKFWYLLTQWDIVFPTSLLC